MTIMTRVGLLMLQLIIFSGLTETQSDKLRSILAQAHYTHTVREFSKMGIPFRCHCYVPEMDPITGREFHEREDHTHLLKVIAIHTWRTN